MTTDNLDIQTRETNAPRVVVVGLASCFGCQLQITNVETHLLEILGQIDLRYWQLASSEPMPNEFDVAVIEGAVTTQEAVQSLRSIRDVAKSVISIGSCAVTAGIPGMAAASFESRLGQVYSDVPAQCDDIISPVPVSSIIDVDYEVRCCPIDSFEFLEVLQKALYGSNRFVSTQTMCGDCKRNESSCFFGQGRLCLGLVTVAGCGARCVNLGRPCNGCRGLSPDANLEAARLSCKKYGVSVDDFNKALEMFNQVNPTLNLSVAKEGK